VTRGEGVRPSGEHVGDLVPVYFAEITSMSEAAYGTARTWSMILAWTIQGD